MSPLVQLAAVVAVILGLLGAMTLLARIARARRWHPEVARKLVHIAAAGLAIPLPWLFADAWPVWLLLGLALAAMLAMRTPLLAGPGRALHAVERRSWGDVLLVVSVGLLFLLHGDEPVLYVLPLLVLALGDAAAALTGSAYGRNFYRTEDGRKSLEGSAMFFLVTLVLAMVALLLLTGIGRSGVILVALAIAGFATMIEADSWQGFDNLFLPMGVFLFLAGSLVLPAPGDLAPLLLPVVAVILAYGLSRAAGMGAQVARIHGVAMFLILSATNVWNAILPALVLAIHAGASLATGGGRRSAETLDMVGGLALLSFAFLGLGTACGVSAINFYGLACAVLAALYGARGLMACGSGVLARAGAGGLAAGLWLVWHRIILHNSPPDHWHGPIGLPAALLLGGALALALGQPQRLAGQSGLRVTLLGGAPVLALFLVLYLRHLPGMP